MSSFEELAGKTQKELILLFEGIRSYGEDKRRDPATAGVADAA